MILDRKYIKEMFFNHRTQSLLRCFLFIVAIAAGLWFLNLSVAYWWAAGGPPDLHPEEYVKRGNLSFFISIFCFVFSGYWLWKTRKNKG